MTSTALAISSSDIADMGFLAESKRHHGAKRSGGAFPHINDDVGVHQAEGRNAACGIGR
jgi:hypothetical protein